MNTAARLFAFACPSVERRRLCKFQGALVRRVGTLACVLACASQESTNARIAGRIGCARATARPCAFACCACESKWREPLFARA